MALFSQLRLLLHKNWTLRRRQPVILALELFWPVVVVLIVVAVRHAIPPTPKEDCYYRARAQPSAGLLPFVQSYVCTINNTCEDATSYEEIPSYPDSYLNKMLPQVMPLFKNTDIMGLIESLPSGLKLTRLVVDAVLQPDIRKILGSDIQVQDLFKDPEHLKSLISNELHVLSPFASDALLRSTLNFPKILSGVSKWGEPKFWTCNSAALQGWLIFPDHDDAGFVSNELCSLISRQWSSFVPVILQELNWIGIAEKLQVLLRTFGSPDEGDGLVNIFRMAETLVDRKDLLDIANKLDRMKGAFRLVPALIKLMNDLRTTKVDFEFLRTMVSDVHSITGDKNVSLHLDTMLNFTEKVWKWMDAGPTPIYTQPVPFGSLLENKSAVEQYFLSQLSLSTQEAEAILTADVSPEVIQEVLESGGDASQIFCTSSDVVLTNGDPHVTPLASANQKLRQGFCAEQGTELQLKTQPNLFRFARAASTDVFASTNLTQSMDSLEESLRFFSHSLLAKFNGSVPELDVLWKLTASVVHVLLRNDWDQTSPQNQTLLSLVPLLDVIPAILPQRYHQTLARGFVSVNVFLTLANNISRIATESDSLLVDDIRSHLPLVRRILRLGPDAVRKIFTLLSNETKLKQVVDSSERLDKLFCNTTKLRELFADDSTNTSLLLMALCKPGVASFLEGLSRGMGVSSAAEQIEEMITKFRNTTGQKFYDVSVTNFTSLAMKAQTLLNYVVSGTSNNREKWRRLLHDLGSEFRHEQWQKVWVTFDSESVPVLTSLYMKLLHKQLRESSSYDEIRKVAIALTSILEPIFDAVGTVSGFVKVNNIYWPLAIETFLKTLQDNAKFQRLLRVEDWSNATCTRSTFWEVLVIPLSVNANDLQRFLCNVTTSVQRFVGSSEWADFLYSVRTLDATDNRKKMPDDVVWTNLTNQIRVLYGAYRQIVADSHKRQYNLRELLLLTQQTFSEMPQNKKAQLGLVTFFEGLDLLDAGLQQKNRQIKTWNGLKAWLHDAHSLFGIITQNLSKIAVSRQIVVDDVTSGLPNLSTILIEALISAAPVIEAVSETFLTNPEKLLSRILAIKNWSRIPCKGISLADFFNFSTVAEMSLRNLESELCQNHSFILNELSRHPLILALEGRPVDISSVKWRTMANAILDFQALWRKGFPADITLFPDVGNFSSNGFQDALDAARNLSRIGPSYHFRSLLRSADVFVSFLAHEATGHSNKDSETQAIKVLLKSISTVSILFEEMDKTLIQIIGGERNLVHLLGSDIDQLLFSVMENLDKYLYASMASITDLSFPVKFHHLMPSNREWSFQEICKHSSELDELITVPVGELLNISSLITPLCQKNITRQIFRRDKIEATAVRIRRVWESEVHVSNDSIIHLAYTIRNVTDRMDTYRRLRPRPELHWGFNKNMFNRTKWKKFQADVIHLLANDKEDINDLVLQRSQAAVATTVLFLAKEPRLQPSLETLSGLMKMLTTALKVAGNNADLNSTTIPLVAFFQNTSQLWFKAAKWIDEHGVEFMDAFLNTIIETPEKVVALFSQQSPWKEWCNHDLNLYLTYPANVTGNASAQQDVCSIKWHLFPQQLRAEGCQSETNGTTLAVCFASSYSELFTVIQDLRAKNGTTALFRDKLMVWIDTARFHYHQYFKSNRSTDAMFWMRKITGIFDTALQTSGLSRWIVATQHILNWINTKLNLIRESKFDVVSIMANYPELTKVLRILDKHILPFTRSWIITIYSRPDKIAGLLQRPVASFCNTSLSDALAVHNTSFNPDQLRDDICHLNTSLIVDDLIAFSDWRSLKAAVLIPSGNVRSSSGETLNHTMIAIERMADILKDLSRVNTSEISVPLWLNISVWKDTDIYIANYLHPPPRFSSFAISLLDYFLEQNGYGAILSLSQEWFEAVYSRTELILKSSKGGDVGIESLFTGFPTLQLVMSPILLHLPLFTKLFVTFSQEERAEYQKLTTYKSWSSFCNSSTQTKLLELFNSSSIGQTWLGNLCATNTTQLTEELEEFLMVPFYENANSRLYNRTGEFNGTKVVESFIEAAKNIQIIVRSSRLHREIEPFLNESVWNTILGEVGNRSGFQQSLNSSQLHEEISELLKNLQNSSLFFKPAFVQKLSSFQNLTRWVLLKINLLAGSTEKESFPTVKKIVSLVNKHLPDLLEECGRLLLGYPQLPQLLAGGLGTFCHINASEDHEMNTTYMHLLLCDIDHQVLTRELQKAIGADDLVASFKGLTSTTKVNSVANPFNVTNFYKTFTDFKQSINLLVQNGIQQTNNVSWLKPVVWQNVWNRMETVANTTFQQHPLFWVRWLDVPLARLQSGSKGKEIVPALQKVAGIIEWLQQLSTHMPVKKNTTWSSIIGQFPQLKSILHILSNDAVRVVEALVITAVRHPQQLSYLFKRNAIPAVCSEQNLTTFLNDHNDFEPHLKPVIEQVCALDIAATRNEIQEIVAWPTLRRIVQTNYSTTLTVNSSFLLHMTEGIQEIFETLRSADFQQPFLNLSSEWRNKTIWQDMADRLQKEMTTANFSHLSVKDWMSLIIRSTLGNGNLSRRAREHNLISAHVYIKLSSNIVKMLLASNSTSALAVMKVLYKGHTNVQLLVDVLDNLPDVLSIFIATFMHPLKAFNLLRNISSGKDWKSSLCAGQPEDRFVLPMDVKEENMHILNKFICLSNFKELFTQLDPMNTDNVFKTLQLPFDEAKFLQDVDEFLWLIDDVIKKRTIMSRTVKTVHDEWQPFMSRMEKLGHLVTSADWASLKTAMGILGPTLETRPLLTRPIYHRIIAVLHDVNVQLDAVLNTTAVHIGDNSTTTLQHDGSSVAVNLTTTVQMVLWWSGCKVEEITEELSNCNDDDLKHKMFWEREKDFTSPCIPLKFTELIQQLKNHNEEKADPLASIPVPWEKMVSEVQDISSKLWRLYGRNSNATSALLKWQCNGLDARKSVQRLMYTVISLVPKSPELMDVRDALAAIFSIFDGLYDQELIPLSTVVRDPSAFERYLVSDVGLPSTVARNLPSETLINTNEEGWRLVHNQTNVCADRRLWARAVTTQGSTLDQHLRKVFCASKSIAPFLDMGKMRPNANNQNGLGFHTHDDGVTHQTSSEKILNRNHIIESAFLILRLLDRYPHWRSVSGLLQSANDRLSQVLSYAHRFPNKGFSWYDLLSNVTLFTDFVDFATSTMPNNVHPRSKTISYYFSLHPNETQYFCGNSSRKPFATSIISSELGNGVGNVTTLFDVLCKEDPSKWNELLILEAGIPKGKVGDVLHSAMTLLPENSDWNSPRNQRSSGPGLNWNELRLNTYRFADLMQNVPPQFVPEFRWSFWKRFFEDSLPAALPNIAKIIGLRACSLIEHKSSRQDFSLATIVFHVISNQVQGFPGLQSVTCELPNMNLPTLYDQLMQYGGIMETIQGIYNITTHVTQNYTCNEMVEWLGDSTEQVLFYINYNQQPKNQRHMDQCYLRMGQTTAFGELDRYLRLFMDGLDLVQELSREIIRNDNDTTSSLSLSSVIRSVQDAMTTLQSQSSVFVPLRSIRKAKEQMLPELRMSGHLDQKMALAFLGSDINLSMLNFINFSIPKLSKMLCNQREFYKVVRLHTDASISYYELRRAICDSNVTAIAAVLMSTLYESGITEQFSDLQNDAFYKWDNVYEVGNRIEAIFHQMTVLSNAAKRLNFEGHFSKIKFAESVIGILHESSFQAFVEGITALRTYLHPVIANTLLDDDLDIILTGLKSLQNITNGELMPLKYNIKKFFTNFNVIASNLSEVFGLTAEDVNAFGQSDLTLNSLFRVPRPFTTFKDVACDIRQLSAILSSATSTLLGTLVHSLCDRNDTALDSFIALCADNVNYYLLVRQMFLGSLHKLGQSALLNSEETEDTIQLLPKLGKLLPNITAMLKSLHYMEEFSDILEEFQSPTDLTQFRGSNSSALALSQSSPDLRQRRQMPLPSLTEYVPSLLRVTGNLFCGKPLRNFLDDFAIIPDTHYSFTAQDQEVLNELPTRFCKNLYTQILQMKAGPVIWSYLKPLMRGKILYTPLTPLTEKIMHQVNGTLQQIAIFSRKLNQWSSGTENLRSFNQSRLEKLEAALNLTLVREFMEQLVGNDLTILTSDLSTLLQEVHRFDKVLSLVEVLAEAMQCISLDRFVGVSSEIELENLAQKLYAEELFMAGVVFLNVDPTRHTRSADEGKPLKMPSEIAYKIRMDIDNVPSTSRLKQWFWRPGPEDNFANDLRYFRGFVQLQDILDLAIIQTQAGNNVLLPPTYTQQFPYPCFLDDEFGFFLKGLVPLIITLAWIFLIAFFIRERVLERELSLEQTMRMMGLRSGIHWCAWFISCFIVMVIVVSCIVLTLRFGSILPLTNVALLYLFLIDYAFAVVMFCYMMSTCFNSATIAALTSVIVYLISYLPFVIILTLEAELIFWQKILSNVVMSTAFSYGCLYIARYEEQNVGLQWNSVWTSPIPQDDFSFSWSCIMLLCDGTLYFVMGLVISHFRSGSRQAWSSMFGGTTAKRRTSKAGKNSKRNSGSVHLAFCEHDYTNENHLSSLAQLQLSDSKRTETVGLSLNHLHKVFDEGTTKAKTAVDHLSLDFFENQITTLLGQNGAGKTTTIHLLTGMFSPTSGSCFIYGQDVQKNFLSIRQNLGVCPQKNVLFPLFSVREHLEFYCKLKGTFASKQICDDVDRMLDSMNLWHKQDELVCNLSDGTRRRLCVAIAFIGGSRTIILDEPTSGVDPVARRKIWDLIVAHKNGRTILLTTHHMDEADILSDRVAILHQGKLLCCGSPHFLKTQFGSGYQVTITKRTGDSDCDSDSGAGSFTSSTSSAVNCDSSVLLDFLRRFVPNVRLAEDHGVEMVFTLPYFSDQGLQNKYDVLFSELENHQTNLGIGSYGLSCATLEEVFLTVCAEADAGYPITPCDPKNWVLSDNPEVLKRQPNTLLHRRRSSKLSLKDLHLESDEGFKFSSSISSDYYLTGCSLMFHQLGALLKKRSSHALRDWSSLFSTIVLPCLFVALAMGFSLLRSVGHKQDAPLQLTPTIYGPDTYSFLSLESEASNSSFLLLDGLLGHPNRTVAHNCLDERGLTPLCEKWPLPSWSQERCGCHIESSPKCIVKPNASLVQYFVQNENNLIFNLTGINISLWILNSDEEFRDNRYGGLTFGLKSTSNKMQELEQENVKVWYNNKGYHALPSYLNTLHNAHLRASLNESAGNPTAFKITTYNHPIILSGGQLSKETIMQHVADVGVALVFVVAFSFIPASFIVFIVQERVREEKRLQFVSGVSPLLYWSATYLWNLVLTTVAVGLAIALIAVVGLPTYVVKLNIPALACLLFLYCWATTPLMYILEKLFLEASLANMVLFCVNVFIGVNTMVCTLLLSIFQNSSVMSTVLPITRWVFLIFPQYALGGSLVELAKNSIQAEIFARFGRDTYNNPFNLEITGLHMIVLAVQGLIFFIVNFLLEYHCTTCSSRRSKVSRDILFGGDTDVLLEKKRVHEETNNDLLRLYDLTKVYSGRSLAVDGVCLGIPRGECFGLLGVNGAGKTTTFRMMTGQLKPTSGNVQFKRHSIAHILSSASRAVGFCPQANALDDLLTAEELLRIYGKFRGIPSSILPQIVHRTLEKFHLQPYAKRKTQSYSLGMKRKLCVAISVLGDPELVLMDEPTSGMDPSSRRHVWTNILKIIKDKRSVVLTSHSMEECDNLCSRIAIMVNGKFQCLGGPQYLKHKFGEGHTLKLRVHEDVLDWGHIISFIHDHFPLAILKARHCNTIEFLVPTKHITLSQIFARMESQKDALGVEDFSVSQTTLDQVFVNFVRQQSDSADERIDKQSRFRHRKNPALPGNHSYTNSSCSLDDEGINSLNQPKPMTVQFAHRRTPKLSRYNETDYDTTKF